MFPVAMLAGIGMVPVCLFAAFWSLFCFVGGPDGKTGSRESIIAGIISLLVATLSGAGCVLFLKASTKKEDIGRSRFYSGLLVSSPIVLAAAAALLIALARG